MSDSTPSTPQDDRLPFDGVHFAHYRATTTIATTDLMALASKVREHYQADDHDETPPWIGPRFPEWDRWPLDE